MSTPWVPLGEWLHLLGPPRPRVQIRLMVIVGLPCGQVPDKIKPLAKQVAWLY